MYRPWRQLRRWQPLLLTIIWFAIVLFGAIVWHTDDLVEAKGWDGAVSAPQIGQATAIAVDSHNHLFVFHRADREWIEPLPHEPIVKDTIVMLDPVDGSTLNSWGGGQFVLPHGLSIDSQDNVWVTDVGSHQVHKFSHDGELLMSLGVAGVAGNDHEHFALPTDVAFLSTGEILISDGYRNSRIVKYSSDGTYLEEWGRPGSGRGEFNVPHSIATDAEDRVYVADRGNSRIQVFDADGTFLSEWSRSVVGRPYAVQVSRGGDVFVLDGGDQPRLTRARVLHFDPAGALIETNDRRVDGFQLAFGHDLALAPEGFLYTVDIRSHRIHKFLPKWNR